MLADILPPAAHLALLATPRQPMRMCSLSSLRSFGTHVPLVRAARSARAQASPDLLRGVDPEHREDVARVVEQAERAVADWSQVVTDFYTPPVVADALACLRRLADVAAVPWGGYPQAERCRLVLGRPEVLGAAASDPAASDAVALLQVKGNFMFDPATHRDFLGACLGTGIERSKVGDILVQGEAGAQVLVAPPLVPHLELTLLKVRSVGVTARGAPLQELKAREPKVQELRSVEASMRLDAVASAGFRMPRSKLAELIKSGDVRVNWRPVLKASAEVRAGDVVSVTGKGRLEVRGAEQTKKGKWAVEMVRFV